MKKWLAFAVLAALAAGCGNAPDDAGNDTASTDASEQIRVAFVTNNASDFWKIARAGTEAAAKDFNCDVEFRIPAGGTAADQQQIMEDLMVTGISGIAVSPNDPDNWTEVLNEIAEKVNLVTQDSDAPNSNRACYIGTDNFAAGQAAGELIISALPDGGKIMVFVGKMDAQNAQDRLAGIKSVLEGTSIEIADVKTDETDRAKAIANVQTTLVSYPDIAALVGLWSYNGPAILNAVRDSGKLDQVKIIAFDEEDETLQGVQDGHIAGTIVQQPYQFGYESVKVLSELAQGDLSSIPESKQIFIPVQTITQANVVEFWSQLKERLNAS
ncbi:MAG: sugar-binding protein [Candidatus Hydrogenedentes bacterium]|nr:sugar-binding protein [Candidatus Hydrogenedentota bacterium]